MRIDDSYSNQILSLIKPIGKEIPLTIGEVIEATVIDIFPGGGLTIKVKDGYLPVRTDLRFALNQTVSLKVLGQSGAGKELCLQVIGTNTPPADNEARTSPKPLPETESIVNQIQKILDEISRLCTNKTTGRLIEGSQINTPSELIQLRTLWRGLLDTLSREPQHLSPETKSQIQQLLRVSAGLKAPFLQDPALEMIFQLIKNKVEADEGRTKPVLGVKVTRIESLCKITMDQILNLITQEPENVPSAHTSPVSFPETGNLKGLIEALLKALPEDIQSLPRSLRTEIQLLLQFSLKSLGEDVPQKMVRLVNQLPEVLDNPTLIQPLRNRLLSLESLQAKDLKAVLENSGVVLEAKLKSLIESLPPERLERSLVNAKIKDDLKSILGQIEEALLGKSSQDSSPPFIQRWLDGAGKNQGGELHSFQKELGGIETILKDVQTFQLLSKVTDSFYTYLPVQWAELKRGELVFKRRRQPSGETSYSCGIHLDLNRLGAVSVFIYMHQRDFFVTFKVAHQGLNDLIQGHLEDLKKHFRDAGLNLKTISTVTEMDHIPDPSDRIESEETLVSIRI